MQILLNKPNEEKYKKLIQIAFDICDQFLFIKHSQLHYDETTETLINKLKSSFIVSRIQNEWPGTISVPTAEVYYYKTDDRAKEIVISSAKSLYNWCAPHLPDDLCFIKNDNPWLITTSHEHFSCIETDDIDELKMIKEIDGLVSDILE